jgi:ketosteroid isomerase-like protein
MSGEDLELVRSAYEAFARADTDALRNRFLAPDVEWHTPPEIPFEGPHRGVDDVCGLIEEWIAPFDRFTTVLEEVIDAGNRVIVRHRMCGKGRESGVDVDMTVSQVVTVRDGKVIRMDDFWTREEALEAVRQLQG